MGFDVISSSACRGFVNYEIYRHIRKYSREGQKQQLSWTYVLSSSSQHGRKRVDNWVKSRVNGQDNNYYPRINFGCYIKPTERHETYNKNPCN